MEDKLLKELYLGFMKIHILHHAAKEKIYGKEFSEELERHGYRISYGTLYPVFHKMEELNYLLSENQKVNGKIRRYYSITEKGKRILELAKTQAKELVAELYEK